MKEEAQNYRGYSLALVNKLGIPERITGYSKVTGFQDFKETSLESIAEFTSLFENEDDLKTFLLDCGIITMDNFDNHVGIYLYTSKQTLPKCISLNICYQPERFTFINSHKVDLFDVKNLISFYRNHLKNKKFMKEFFKVFTPLISGPKISEYFARLTSDYDYFLKYNTLTSYAFKNMYDFINIYSLEFNRKYDLITFATTYIHQKKEINSHGFNSITANLKRYQEFLNDDDLTESEKEYYESVIQELTDKLKDFNGKERR